MRRTALLAVALAAMLALAGCGGTGGNTTAPTTENTTTQPADYPPGVTADGVESGFELTGAHASAIQESGYTVNRTTTVTLENGTAFEAYTQTTSWTADAVQAVREYSETPPGATYTHIGVWTNRSTAVFQRTTVDGNTSVSRVAGGVGEIDIVRTPGQWKETLYTLVASGDMNVTRNGDTVTLTPAAEFNVSTEKYGEVTPTTLELVVQPNGVITSVDFTFETTIDGQTATVEQTITFETSGTTVTTPDWV